VEVDEASSLRTLLFGLHGRVSRRTWWLWAVAMPLGMALYLTVLLRVAGIPPRATDTLVNLLLLWPMIAVSVKRWHDRGKSGWWVLVTLIPLAGWLWALAENGFRRGDRGVNRFGEPPLEPGREP